MDPLTEPTSPPGGSRTPFVVVRALVPKSPRIKATALAVALGLFTGGIVFSWRRLAPIELLVLPILLNAALVPIAVAASAWQVRLIARIAGVDPGWWKPLRVTTLGTLSGLLPVSSGTLVRGGAVLYWGATAGRTGRAFIVDFLLWLAASLIIAGSAALWLGHVVIAGSFLVVAVTALPAAVLAGGTGGDRSLQLQLFAARAAGVVVDVPRLAAAFAGVGLIASTAQAAVLTAPAVLASAAFFLPGGLGIREGLTAFLGAAIGFSAAGAFLAAAVNRLLALSIIAAWEGGYWVVAHAKSINARRG